MVTRKGYCDKCKAVRNFRLAYTILVNRQTLFVYACFKCGNKKGIRRGETLW